ncbi:hypothetical protein PRIPAC_93321, partial [Pristionchus pacificus]|uniref:SH3 domain-containing protein n=1 Tax=Pristionchus pacificus TaxID=54126 RepID=A0A2A6C9D0_PRIPA
PDHRQSLMNFKAFTGGGGGGDSSTSFAAAKALFEAAKKPENRALAAAAAKNPVIRNAAISAAQNPQASTIDSSCYLTRQAMVSAASTYTANQNNAPSTPVLRPEPAPKPPTKDYSSSSYGSSVPSRPTPLIGASKPVYPDLMSELKALNIGRDNEPAPSYSSTPSWSQPAYQPPAPQPSYLQPTPLPQPSYHQPAPPQPTYHPPPAPPQPVMQRQDWTKFSDAPARPPPPKNIPLSPKSTSPTSEAYAVVKFPHTGSHFDEVTCIAGDRIVLKREVDDQWIYGPVAPVTAAAAAPAVSAVSPGGVHIATAVYDYVSQEPGDLSFNSGASIKIIERVGTEWLSGELHGRHGIFPVSFVDCPTLSRVPLRAAAAAAIASPATVFTRHTTVAAAGGYGSYSSPDAVTATFDYNSGVDGDLVFFTGDVIEVLERLPDGEWLRGRSRGQIGLVPMTYVSQSSTTPSHSTSNNSLSGAAAAPSRFPAGTPLNPPITVTATTDYHTGESDCLYFSRGDQILVTEYVDNEWAKGKLAEFKTLPAGYFPRGYVQ